MAKTILGSEFRPKPFFFRCLDLKSGGFGQNLGGSNFFVSDRDIRQDFAGGILGIVSLADRAFHHRTPSRNPPVAKHRSMLPARLYLLNINGRFIADPVVLGWVGRSNGLDGVRNSAFSCRRGAEQGSRKSRIFTKGTGISRTPARFG